MVLLITAITPAIAAPFSKEINQRDEDFVANLLGRSADIRRKDDSNIISVLLLLVPVFIMLGVVTFGVANMDKLQALGPTFRRTVPTVPRRTAPPTHEDKQSGMDQKTVIKALLQPYRVEALVQKD